MAVVQVEDAMERLVLMGWLEGGGSVSDKADS